MRQRIKLQWLLQTVILIHHLTSVLSLMTSVKFRTMTSPSGSADWCSVDQPSTVVQMACGPVPLQEKRCALECAIDGCCLLYQFKVNSYLCELFEYTTTNFSVIPSCSSRSITMSESLEYGFICFNVFNFRQHLKAMANQTIARSFIDPYRRTGLRFTHPSNY